MIVIVSLSMLIFLQLTFANPSLQCGEWHAFKDEKCYKVFSNKELMSYSDAINICYQNEGSIIASIVSQEEQDFLFSLLNDVHKTVNDVWIGAEYKQNKLKLLSNITVNYTNWANGYPVNNPGYECVNLVIEEPLHGKWHNVLCTKNNVVVCEKPQNWLFSYLQTTVMELRKSYDSIALQLESTKTQLLNTESKLQAQIIKSTTESTPPGTVAYFSNTTAPLGWLKANGQSVSRTTYANLFASIGTTFGSGDGSTTFTLPDLRGEFIRGWSDGRDVDKDRSFGSFQWGSSIPLAGYINNITDLAGSTANQDRWQFSGITFDGGYENNIPPGQTRDGLTFPDATDIWQESMGSVATQVSGIITSWNLMKGTRPRNVALLACIKY